MADINVLVTVDTETLTQLNVNNTVVLSDDNDDSDDVPGDSSTFDIVKAGGGVSVQWTPVAKNGTDTVTIRAINKVSGDDCFAAEPANAPGTEMWLASLVDNDSNSTLELKYDIVFSVSNKEGDFTLDPKIKVPPKDDPNT